MPQPSVKTSAITNSSFEAAARLEASSWSARYGEQHRLERIVDFPKGIAAPEKVRLYWRRDHYVLQWWDPQEKRTLSDRVNGDLVAALTRARQIEQRLSQAGRSGLGQRKLKFGELIDRFLEDAERRASSAEIDPATVIRYRSALRYLREFASRPDVARNYLHPAGIDRLFLQRFSAFLQEQVISPNGHGNTAIRPMRGQHFVLQTARAAFSWAADPERGNLLPSDFRSPFRAITGSLRRPRIDLTREPPITVAMTVDFVRACDDYQFHLFLPLILFGLRAAEPRWLFHEDIQGKWLNVQCHPELDHLTKGQRDKRFPLVESLSKIWDLWLTAGRQGLLLRSRTSAGESSAKADSGSSFDSLVLSYRTRCHHSRATTIQARRKVRDLCLKEAGAISYDQIDSEFRRLSRELGWKSTATLKGFRHLFATALENSGCPETYRRFYLGHSQGRAASVHYTHLDQLERHFQKLLDVEYSDIVVAITARAGAISLSDVPTTTDSEMSGKRHRS